MTTMAPHRVTYAQVVEDEDDEKRALLAEEAHINRSDTQDIILVFKAPENIT